VDGVIVVDKPAGWTSHDVVNRMRRLANTRRVGHLGTLDPIATGVLPLVIGRATRLAQFYTKNDKSYDAVIRFGYSTSTYDAEGQATSPDIEPRLERARIEEIFANFRGTIDQTPPPVSAKKIAGTPAYKLARKNAPVELPPVQVSVYSLDIDSVEGRDVRVRVRCSAGTYLRAIAHEAGQALGCGAFLYWLRRTASGEFTLDRARTLEQLAELSSAGTLSQALTPGPELLPDFPNEIVDTLTASQIRNGRDFRVSPFQARKGSRFVKAISAQGELIAIGEARLPNVYHPVLVL
jgi:tRNA pseudouridine55 synthase